MMLALFIKVLLVWKSLVCHRNSFEMAFSAEESWCSKSMQQKFVLIILP